MLSVNFGERKSVVLNNITRPRGFYFADFPKETIVSARQLREDVCKSAKLAVMSLRGFGTQGEVCFLRVFTCEIGPAND